MPGTTTTTAQLAEEAAGWLETAKRPGETDDYFTRTKEGAPEWVTALVFEAHGHGDFLPDWRYATISAALDWLADGNDPEDSFEFADSAVDVYTGDLYAWLASNLRRAGYCDEAAQEYVGTDNSITASIMRGQFAEALEVFGLVLQELEKRADV